MAHIDAKLLAVARGVPCTSLGAQFHLQDSLSYMEVGFETVRRIVLGTLRIQGNYDSIPYLQDDIWIFFRVSHVATRKSHDGLEGRAYSTRVSVPAAWNVSGLWLARNAGMKKWKLL